MSEFEIPTYIVKHVPLDYPIDGVWNKWPWINFTALGPFKQFNGRDCVQRTYAKLGWNSKFLYAAFLCTDDDIWGSYRQRDEPIHEQEVVELFIAPGGVTEGETSTYFEFEVSPHNVVLDLKVVNTTGFRDGCTFQREWDCASLRTAVQVEGTLDDLSTRDQWWSAELAIPWSELGGPPQKHDEMPLNLYRIDRDRRQNRGGDEYQCWSPTLTPHADNHVPGRFGWVGFA